VLSDSNRGPRTNIESTVSMESEPPVVWIEGRPSQAPFLVGAVGVAVLLYLLEILSSPDRNLLALLTLSSEPGFIVWEVRGLLVGSVVGFVLLYLLYGVQRVGLSGDTIRFEGPLFSFELPRFEVACSPSASSADLYCVKYTVMSPLGGPAPRVVVVTKEQGEAISAWLQPVAQSIHS
jgi:hypothetical protein